MVVREELCQEPCIVRDLFIKKVHHDGKYFHGFCGSTFTSWFSPKKILIVNPVDRLRIIGPKFPFDCLI